MQITLICYYLKNRYEYYYNILINLITGILTISTDSIKKLIIFIKPKILFLIFIFSVKILNINKNKKILPIIFFNAFSFILYYTIYIYIYLVNIKHVKYLP